MFSEIFNYLSFFDDFIWTYVSVPFIIILGTFFTCKFKCAQVTKAPSIFKSFINSLKTNHKTEQVSSLQAFFTSIGGCIGIGNLVAVCTAIQIGGPGAIFWMWVAAFLGMIIKYSEAYLGIRFRQKNSSGGYDGGPMYYLQKTFKTKFIPILVAILIAIYGTEVYMFKVITDSISINYNINSIWVIIPLLMSIILVGSGGVRRVGKVCSIIIPFFLIVFIFMASWILANNVHKLFDVFSLIFTSAFSGHAALGGFAGSSILLTMSQGIARGCYTGDIGICYAGIVHAEADVSDPKAQASLSILGVFLDTFIVCTTTTIIIVITDVWHLPISASNLLQVALSQYFPYMEYFMPVFITLLGYSSLIAFYCVGLKCSDFLLPKFGRKIYYVYSIMAFILFSFVSQLYALTVMSISGALLLCINVYGIYRLRKYIKV